MVKNKMNICTCMAWFTCVTQVQNANANDVHTLNANARKVRCAGAVEVFFPDGGRGTCVFLPCVCVCIFFFFAFAFAFAFVLP